MQDEKCYKHNKRNAKHKVERTSNNNEKTCDFVKAKRVYKKLNKIIK